VLKTIRYVSLYNVDKRGRNGNKKDKRELQANKDKKEREKGVERKAVKQRIDITTNR
jgi:hypothetical protein